MAVVRRKSYVVRQLAARATGGHRGSSRKDGAQNDNGEWVSGVNTRSLHLLADARFGRDDSGGKEVGWRSYAVGSWHLALSIWPLGRS